MSATMTVEEYKARMMAVERKEAAKGLKAHAIIVAAVNCLLIAVNLTFVPEVIWFVFPLVGTSAGVVLHYLFSTLLLDREMARKQGMIESFRQ